VVNVSVLPRPTEPKLYVPSLDPLLINILHLHNLAAARDVIHYEGKKFQLSSVYAPDGSPSPHKPNNFLGPPRAELEEEWEGLIGDINIRLPKSDMDQFSHNANLVNLADGSGYWNTMAVYHGLHCIKRLHHYIHKEYYYEGLNGSEAFRLLEHTGEFVSFRSQLWRKY